MPTKRNSAIRRIATTTLLGCVFLAGCVRITTEVAYFIAKSNGLATLEIAVSKPGIHFNVHGGNADVYQFRFPAQLSVVKASDILSYTVNYATPAIDLPEKGEIVLAIAPGGCDVSVNLLSKDGRPLPVNGNFKQLRCGQNQ